jgi:hypothetical protein
MESRKLERIRRLLTNYFERSEIKFLCAGIQ